MERATSDRFEKLRAVLESPKLSVAMEAHNAISAILVEEAGFDAIWASGLAISTALGVRDASELTWTEVLNTLDYMTSAVELPIILDGDTGYGDFNTVRRLVRRLCERRVAGVCIEDKTFPKTNSFWQTNHQLAQSEEFCGRIMAAKDVQTHSDFVVIARTESLVLGQSVDEAMERAWAYRDAGADAILVHSKSTSADQVLEFASRWTGSVPLIIVPTTYPGMTISEVEGTGISVVIWANHNIRASIQAMKEACSVIMRERTAANIEPNLTSLDELFSLLDYDELRQAEMTYRALHPNQPPGVDSNHRFGTGNTR